MLDLAVCDDDAMSFTGDGQEGAKIILNVGKFLTKCEVHVNSMYRAISLAKSCTSNRASRRLCNIFAILVLLFLLVEACRNSFTHTKPYVVRRILLCFVLRIACLCVSVAASSTIPNSR